MPKEYWVNVYEYPLTKKQWLGNMYVDKTNAVIRATEGLIYRIHVKMKEVKPVKPNYIKHSNKFNWMG